MSIKILVWIIVVTILLVRSYNKSRKKKAERVAMQQQADEKTHEAIVEDELIEDELIEKETTVVQVSREEETHSPDTQEEWLHFIEKKLGKSSLDEMGGEQPTPEQEGCFRTVYQAAEAEGVSAISEETIEERESLLATPTVQPLRLPDGQLFDLRTAMIYDVLLHRRTTGMLGLRTGYRPR